MKFLISRLRWNGSRMASSWFPVRLSTWSQRARAVSWCWIMWRRRMLENIYVKLEMRSLSLKFKWQVWEHPCVCILAVYFYFSFSSLWKKSKLQSISEAWPKTNFTCTKIVYPWWKKSLNKIQLTCVHRFFWSRSNFKIKMQFLAYLNATGKLIVCSKIWFA